VKDEINLRDYVNVVLRQWKVIVIVTVIAVLAGGLVSLFSPNVYEARAGLLIVQTKSEVVFEPQYRTLSTGTTASERAGIIALLKSRTIASQVIGQLGDKLKPEERYPDKLLKMVQVKEQGDLIEISVRANDPGTAAMVANAWTWLYESMVRGLYRDVLPQTEAFSSQAIWAGQEYEEKQKAWENFVASNRIDELNQRITDTELLYDLLLLREQIGNGSLSSASAAADSLAFILLQTQTYTGQSQEHVRQPETYTNQPVETQVITVFPMGLQVSLDTASGLEVTRGDIDRLISALETRSGITAGQSFSQVPEEILRLKRELEQENARGRGIETSRDMAWAAYKMVSGKVVEAEMVSLSPDLVVNLADPASEPASPVGPNRILNIVIALVAGLVAGLVCAFGIEWLRRS
jgi:uncharacterized protein involved in exopolysaccharide biosynthesis